MSTCRYYGKCAKPCDGHGLCVSFRNTTYDCEDFEPMPDIDALLELANQMDYVAGCVRIKGSVAVGWVDRWAKCIREALGVES